jgi:hypothetical protein
LRSKKMCSTAINLMLLETGFDSGGHFVRDIAVLIFVFVPLDIWKNEFSVYRVISLTLVSGAIFTIGLALQWVSNLVRISREIWEAEGDMT